MSELNRRNSFLPILGTAALAATARAFAPEAPPQVMLGRTGIKMSRMGFGTGVKASNRNSALTKSGFKKGVALFRHCYDHGVTFFDMADWYGSHMYCREALRFIPREKVSLMTKLWWRDDGREPAKLSVAHRRQSAKAALNRYQNELDTDYIDMVLLHCLVKKDWIEGMKPYMEVLSEAKERGTVKAVGVSCHDFGAMQTAADLPWVDIMLARINPFGVMCDASPAEVLSLLQRAKLNGKVIIGMKIFGEGRLLDKREQCMKYAQSCGVLDAMTIGVVTPEQMDENLALMARYPVGGVIPVSR